MEEQKKLIVFRIIQESLQNILKHAHARKVEVVFYYTANHFKCEVKDDGTGFNMELIRTNDGLGLQNMINRATLIGGQVSMSSIINKGTTITIDLPYE
jgi:two-component system, NarL family, sensor kinase